MIEHGDYFHRDTLTLVRTTTIATRYWEPGNVPFKVSCFIPYGDNQYLWLDAIPYDRFCREFIRNEPLTPELLERCGGPEWQLSPADTAVWRAVEVEEDVPWSSGGMELRTDFDDGRGAWTIRVEHPDTLRDLLVVLRTFGVEMAPLLPVEAVTEPVANATN